MALKSGDGGGYGIRARHIKLGRRGRWPVAALIELGKCYLAIGDPAGARSAVAEAERIACRRPDLWVLNTELAELRRRVAASARALAGPSTLTPAELGVLPMLSTHLSFEEIGDRLHVSRYTVKSHAVEIYESWARRVAARPSTAPSRSVCSSRSPAFG